MNKPGASSKTNEFHWVVDFRVRPSDRRQALMINAVGPMMFHRLAEVWLEAIAPEAHDLEEESMATRRIAFRTRAVGRKFVHVWGGRLGRLDHPILGIVTIDGPRHWRTARRCSIKMTGERPATVRPNALPEYQRCSESRPVIV